MKEIVHKLLKVLGIDEAPPFPHYFVWALTHSSYANENGVPSYERLEFLGDTIVGFVIAHQTFEKFPNMAEGEMAKVKAVVGSEPVLSDISKEIGLSDLVFIGRSLRSSEDSLESIFADVFESTMAATFLNFGFEKTYVIVKELLEEKIEDATQKKIFFDYKTMLQEYTQEEYGVLPEYELVEEKGPAHKKVYIFSVAVNGEIYGKGSGKSKKSAEQMAAKNALKRMRKI
ncbi:ribonuclease III [Mesoaciditoga lauensis]|uniref:ribonuclease III n=1 Tax=Mesoaciditoga lauensis TaxID=1495039 RepID=UPI00056C6F51|nr:ribonuclease III [Mesoaciditoga lauensis]